MRQIASVAMITIFRFILMYMTGIFSSRLNRNQMAMASLVIF